MKTLVIVESGKKGNTIQKLLGEGYKVVACGGHIRDMTKNTELGFDRDTLNIHYEMSNERRTWVQRIRKQLDLGNFDHVILASDPDREGEAIAHSLKEEIGLQDHEYERCKFNEITKEAITKAIKGKDGSAREQIDQKLVDAQETRRILDRYIGWTGTKAVTEHILKQAPIGRVQSQALRFVVERDKVIKNFTPQEHYSITFKSKTKANECAVDAWCSKLDTVASGIATKVQNGESESNVWLDKAQANKLQEHLKTKPKALCVKSLVENRFTSPPPPFTTTTMQQAAINNLGLSGKEVDKLAQELYQEGYITYPRTDSTRMSEEGYHLILEWGRVHGIEIVSPQREFRTSSDAQDAHECIRPAVFNKEPTELSSDHQKLFKLILARAVMSQMMNKEYEHRESHFKIEFEGKDYLFKAEGNTTLSPGFTTFYKDNSNVNDADIDSEDSEEHESTLPLFSEGETVEVDNSELKSAKTKAPPRYTQAKLNRKLDEQGIGRPSTYSSIFEKIVEHHYVQLVKTKKKALEIEPTELGIEVVEATQDVFKIMQPEYTREMEEKLDAIADNSAQKDEVAHEFLNEFDRNLVALSKIENLATKMSCTVEDCSGYLVAHHTEKDGKLIRYYKCCDCHKVHFIQNGVAVTPESIMKPFLNDDGSPKFPCPSCGSALRRIQRKDGGFFWGCSNNKKDKSDKKAKNCDYTVNDYNEKPDFNNEGVDERRAEFIEKKRAEGLVHECPICYSDMIEHKGTSKAGKKYHFVKCDECGFSAQPDAKGGGFGVRKAERIHDFLKGSTPKVPCPSCGGALFETPIKEKDGDGYVNVVRCSNVFAKTPPCEFDPSTMTVDELYAKAKAFMENN